jgi:preprotein translocase subunit SecD
VQITGNFTESEAKNLAKVLKSGSLPVHDADPVGAERVADARQGLAARGRISGLIGVGLVLLLHAFYYRCSA